ncbi:MAG: type II toxin-antitoxin system VapC family toxin [Planctomycetota bacterium]
MSRICLDTSAYSHFVRGHAEAVRLIRRASVVAMPVVTLGELKAGFRNGKHETENETGLADFLAQPAIRVLHVDEETSEIYGELFAELKLSGFKASTNDIWIAALALQDGTTVLTFDADFQRIPRVGVVRLMP